MNATKHILLFMILFPWTRSLSAQTFNDSISIVVKVDSIESFGPVKASDPLTPTIVELYCKKNIWLSIEIENRTKKSYKMLLGPNFADFNWSALDCEIQRFDSSINKYVEVRKPLWNPVYMDGTPQYSTFTPKQVVRQHGSFSYMTKINEANRVRVFLKVPKDKKGDELIFSNWFVIPWKSLDHPF
ncbi:MAG TPA: hypothetical protein VFW07_14340 [Parafilimonas sp.]|nr:hypothetical protein [Parafilimonas sp.]